MKRGIMTISITFKDDTTVLYETVYNPLVYEGRVQINTIEGWWVIVPLDGIKYMETRNNVAPTNTSSSNTSIS